MSPQFEKFKKYIKKTFPFSITLYDLFVDLYDSAEEWKCKIVCKFFISAREERVRKRIRSQIKLHKRKIRVGFLVTENEKWGCQILYDKLKAHPDFEPVLLLSSLDIDDKPILQEKFSRNQSFFKQACGDIVEVYDPQHHEFRSLRPYDLDILFYDQPWSIAKKHCPITVSKFALTCYVPYCFEEGWGKIKERYVGFHALLFREYVSHPLIRQHYLAQGYKRENVHVISYPKLESYLSSIPNEKKYIIYAPHHSVDVNSIFFGTFSWNGHFMLEYAKQHPEFHWIFKPHPRCKISFLRAGLFKNKEELDKYYNQWANIGQVCEKGNYMNLFQQAHGLITDCSSFLIEFLPTKQPVIHLRRLDSNDKPLISEQIIPAYYSVFDLPTLKNTLRTVLEEGKDPLHQARLDKLKELNLVQPASDNIVQDLQMALLKD